MSAAILTAEMVNGILDRYIRIHDQIVKFSFRKVLPLPGIFKPIEYCKHEEELGGLATELTGTRQIINLAMRDSALPSPDRQFLERLDLYANALAEAITSLGRLSAELCLKSRNEKEYPWQGYRRDTDQYKAAVERYTQLGKQLNELYLRVSR